MRKIEIIYSKASVKFIKRLDKSLRNRLLMGIDGLTLRPAVGDIKVMQGVQNQLRLRVGKFRILYHQEENKIFIDEVGSRGEIYK